ncbi:tRNA splicing endonuclease subunit SEN34 [Sugiyamaella lignohabitans]|uniref:tRNA-splicing endonuclease subunit SEN34 n=1 Tax=Sugiyamaella lignohabitans TaxID=796027 RepID=A0A167FFD6_9ASCO|nr:tRNA splicing endonuclease subunit SEN34 [Sugiyamaella lignohabitans]ANB15229.1 tRNA splicing endonuclease subunit SEN34 [Sugiyamaella lignohabitans]
MIPINIVGGRGLVFDLDHVKVLREKYHVCGTLIGILPQIPQQNVFMGLPLELMPEDIELLVFDLKVAYLVDDSEAHKQAVSKFTKEDAKEVRAERHRQEQEQFERHKDVMWERRVAALEIKRRKEQEKEKKRLEKLKSEKRDGTEQDQVVANGDQAGPVEPAPPRIPETETTKASHQEPATDSRDNLTSANTEKQGKVTVTTTIKTEGNIETEREVKVEIIEKTERIESEEEKNSADEEVISLEKQRWLEKTFPESQQITGGTVTIPSVTTPTNSSLKTYKPLAVQESFFVPRPSKASYNIYKELHKKGFFLTPGLRFGGQFVAYPGDPLRFHSHHIAIGFNWDQEFAVLDIVGGGRLGTAVKKCWVVGAEDSGCDVKEEDKYRIFSVEWAGFG